MQPPVYLKFNMVLVWNEWVYCFIVKISLPFKIYCSRPIHGENNTLPIFSSSIYITLLTGCQVKSIWLNLSQFFLLTSGPGAIHSSSGRGLETHHKKRLKDYKTCFTPRQQFIINVCFYFVSVNLMKRLMPFRSQIWVITIYWKPRSKFLVPINFISCYNLWKYLDSFF